MTVFKKSYTPMPFSRSEILRYSGCKGTTPEIDALLDECIAECDGIFSYNVCYTQVPVRISDGTLDLGFLKTTSKALMKNLESSDTAVIFAATVGIAIDRLIAKYGKISPSKAVIFQAIGAERIEALCDAFNEDMQKEFGAARPRFSPGYGDFPLEFQKDFFRLLDAPKNIGVSLNDSLLMSPTKSVTAIIGNSDTTCEKGCRMCSNTECAFRKEI